MSGPTFGRLTLPRMSITEDEEFMPGSNDTRLNGRTEGRIYSTQFCNWNAHPYWYSIHWFIRNILTDDLLYSRLIPVVLTVYVCHMLYCIPWIIVFVNDFYSAELLWLLEYKYIKTLRAALCMTDRHTIRHQGISWTRHRLRSLVLGMASSERDHCDAGRLGSNFALIATYGMTNL